jgi:uncharacterized protein (DUF1778 family)
MSASRSSQLQIRVSPRQKDAIRAAARRAGVSMSEWVLSRLLPTATEQLRSAVERLASARSGEDRSIVFAEILDLVAGFSREELAQAMAVPPTAPLDAYWSNYLAATLEQAAAKRDVRVPEWISAIPPLESPAFGSTLASLRLHLLVASPPPFAARNLFVDSALGGRV